MKLTLEATKEELLNKAEELVLELCDRLGVSIEDLVLKKSSLNAELFATDKNIGNRSVESGMALVEDPVKKRRIKKLKPDKDYRDGVLKPKETRTVRVVDQESLNVKGTLPVSENTVQEMGDVAYELHVDHDPGDITVKYLYYKDAVRKK